MLLVKTILFRIIKKYRINFYMKFKYNLKLQGHGGKFLFPK